MLTYADELEEAEVQEQEDKEEASRERVTYEDKQVRMLTYADACGRMQEQEDMEEQELRERVFHMRPRRRASRTSRSVC